MVMLLWGRNAVSRLDNEQITMDGRGSNSSPKAQYCGANHLSVHLHELEA